MPAREPGNRAGVGYGRPITSKNRIPELFFNDVKEVWEAHGKAAIATMAKKTPGAFVNMVAGLMPKEFFLTAKVNEDEITEDDIGQLITIIGRLRSGAAAGAGKLVEGEAVEVGREKKTRRKPE